MPFVLLLSILVSLVIARWGANRKFGFWGYFFASLLLTPLIGALLVIASGKNPDADEAK
ncbi:MAG: hypothetical protein LBN04_02965 [Oscillospiraceae bacterium]|jgi:hypothetical protein|nr:hypothetical protein [Oscillospiraceae bacterium]